MRILSHVTPPVISPDRSRRYLAARIWTPSFYITYNPLACTTWLILPDTRTGARVAAVQSECYSHMEPLGASAGESCDWGHVRLR